MQVPILLGTNWPNGGGTHPDAFDAVAALSRLAATSAYEGTKVRAVGAAAGWAGVAAAVKEESWRQSWLVVVGSECAGWLGLDGPLEQLTAARGSLSNAHPTFRLWLVGFTERMPPLLSPVDRLSLDEVSREASSTRSRWLLEDSKRLLPMHHVDALASAAEARAAAEAEAEAADRVEAERLAAEAAAEPAMSYVTRF